MQNVHHISMMDLKLCVPLNLINEINLDATKNLTHEECVPSLGVQLKNISAWRREQVYCKTLH